MGARRARRRPRQKDSFDDDGALVVGEPMHLLVSATGASTGTVIASEPDSDDPGWRELADLTAVHLTEDGLTETTL